MKKELNDLTINELKALGYEQFKLREHHKQQFELSQNNIQIIEQRLDILTKENKEDNGTEISD